MVRQARASAIPARELFENNPLAMWVYDVETLAFLAVNDAAIRHYGYSRREFLAMTIREIRPPEEIPALLEKTARPVEGFDAAGTWKHRKKDGTIIDVEITTHTLRFAGRKAKLVLANDVTVRNRLEQGLHAAAEEWRRTFDAMSDAVALIDPDGMILRCNKAMMILARKDYPEIIGHRCWEVVHGTADRIPGCPVQEMLTTRKRTEATVPSGSQIHKIVADPLVDESGRFAGAVHIMSDITQQEQARRILHDLALQQQAILDNIPDIAWLKDNQSRFLAVNESFARASGFAPADLVGKTDLDIWPRQLAQRYRADDAEVMRTRTRKVVEEPLADKEGKTTWIETIKTPIIDEGGRVVGTTGIARDITVRKQTETALQASEKKFRTLFEAANDAIYIVDMEGRYLDMNTVAHERLGYTREEMLSKSVAEVDTPEFALRAPERIEQIRKSGKGVFESAHVRKDGTVMPVEINAVVIDHEGRTVLYSIVRDITERIRSAEEKNRLEDQLRQAQKVEAIGRLAGGVAHDFNNLTAIVLGYGEMLLGELRPEDPGRKYVEQIVGAGRRSAALTRQLLAFGRKQTLQPEVLDLNALLRNFESMLGRLLGEDIELDFRLTADAVRIKADPGQIEQVVTNLAVNARDAMPLGGRLTIGTAAAEFDETHPPGHESVIPGRYVLFTLADTGCGMDEATMDRLFEPFFTTKPMGKGTGLGLATTYGIVKQSGGFIWASSETGKGSTFTICLPRTDEQPPPKAIESGGELPRGSAETILMVEDEASLRELCETLLVRLGYTVVAARNGPEALLMVQERGLDPDLVVTDVIMPGMSGAEMASQLRKKRPNLKVLYMSGYPDAAIAHHGVLEPGTPFIQKPFTERALAIKVREALGGRAAAAARPVRRVLMIDDDEQFLDLVGYFCRKRGHFFAGVDSAAAALAALAAAPFDVLLVDLKIPGTSGERVLRDIRAAGHATPAIVLTGDVASADMDALRPLGVVRVTEKSSAAEPLLRAIEAVGADG